MLARSVRMAAAEAPPDVVRGKVIVIGRGRLTQRLLSSGLGRGGFDVESAVDGNEGQALVRLHAPDAVILLDMLAPLDGVSLLEAIRSETTCPVVMLDARDDSAPSIVGFARCANDTAERPNALGELLSLIGGALRPRRAGFVNAAFALVARR
jgi:two-component system alkaline phosphatase synthesis response regulator PhoP